MANLITRDELLSSIDGNERVCRTVDTYCEKLIKNLAENYKLFGFVAHTELLCPIDGLEGSRLSKLVSERLIELGYQVTRIYDNSINGHLLKVSIEPPKEIPKNFWVRLKESLEKKFNSESVALDETEKNI